MAIDYSFLQSAVPQDGNKTHDKELANITLRVDADCYLQCDGEYVDVKIVGNAPVKVQLPTGQHLMEFISTENPNVKVEKVVDFPETGKNYLVLVTELKARCAPSMPQMLQPTATPSNPYLDQLNSMQTFNPLVNMQGFGGTTQTPPPMPESPEENRK